MRAFSYAWFQSGDKDGGLTIRSAIAQIPMLHAYKLPGCMFYRTEVIADVSFILWE